MWIDKTESHNRTGLPHRVEIPPSALTNANGRPAVWVVDQQSQTAALRYNQADVVVSQGLKTGEIVVTAGVPDSPAPGCRVMRHFNLSEWALGYRSLVTYFMLVIAVAGT